MIDDVVELLDMREVAGPGLVKANCVDDVDVPALFVANANLV